MAPVKSPVRTHLPLPVPEPLYSWPHQNGITDPLWPEDYPGNFDPNVFLKTLYYQMASGRMKRFNAKAPTPQELKESYQKDYSGRVARQEFLSVLRADVLCHDRTELIQTFKLISRMVVEETEKKPVEKHVRVFERIPDSYRVTISVGFGESLFVDRTGFDRFGLRSQKPKFLKTMPSFRGDAPSLEPARSASDLILLVASDHPYVNVAIVRYFAEHFNKKFSKKHQGSGKERPMLNFRDVEQGFGRVDKREFLRFDDGIENLQVDPQELRRLVYVDESDNEPAWCINGAYLVYRKIRENMPVWEGLGVPEQERMIGRKKETGKPLSRDPSGKDDMTPVFPDPTDDSLCPLNAHIRKVQPRRSGRDLFGRNDLERRFLRRPYPFFDGLDEQGHSINGLHFIAFMKSIQQQFEHIVNMWQMNANFPKPGAGEDALYKKGILSTIDGGYYFCPPGLKEKNDFFGSGMFVD